MGMSTMTEYQFLLRCEHMRRELKLQNRFLCDLILLLVGHKAKEKFVKRFKPYWKISSGSWYGSTDNSNNKTWAKRTKILEKFITKSLKKKWYMEY